MATVPMCKYCKTRHWLREPHIYGNDPRVATASPAPAKLTFGVTSAKPILPDEFGSPDVWQALMALEARIGALERYLQPVTERNTGNAGLVTVSRALPEAGNNGNGGNESGNAVTDGPVTVTVGGNGSVTRNADKQKAYRERKKAQA